MSGGIRTGGWMVAALGACACAVLALVDTLSGAETTLIALQVLPPLIVATQAGPRQTATVAGLAFALAVVLGIPNEEFGSRDHAVRLLVVGGGSALAVWISALRLGAERERRRITLLAEVGTGLDASLDYELTLDNVAHLAVPGFADWCAVDLVDERGTIRQVGLAHVDPSKIMVAEELRTLYPTDPEAERGVANVLRTGETEVYTEIPDEPLGIKSMIIAPMRAGGRTLGALTFVTGESGRRFDEQDVELATELAHRAATAVENSLLYAERAHIAQTLQRSLLPPVLPDIPGLEVAARFRPAGEGYDVGGDFYDVFDTGTGWGIVIGDVCGKGPEAAALTGLARHTVRAAAMHESDPSRVLTLLNDAIRREHPDSQFCTAAYGHLEPGPARTRLTLASGGHPLPLLMNGNGEVKQVGASGALLGTLPEVHLRNEQLELERGAILVLFTDGVIEAGEPRGAFGLEGLKALLASSAGMNANEIAQRIDTAVVGLSEEPPDDVAVVVLRVRE